MRANLQDRTWIVFLVGLLSLLALLFLPGITAMRRTEQVYREVRTIQRARERTERSLDELQRHMYLVSIRVRELLLDNSPEAATEYRAAISQSRSKVDQQLTELHRQSLGAEGAAALQNLESQLDEYWPAIDPLFGWKPEERSARATYFLREQQRPRRQNILAFANEIARLAEAAYQRQYAEIDKSQQSSRRDIERMIAFAFFIGVVIAGVTIWRISTLESRGRAQREATELAGERLRHLSTQLMKAQEEERKSISRELHDEVGQMVTGLRMELGTLERLRDTPQFQEHLTEAKGLAEETLRAVRSLAVGLRPSVLDLGLAPALQSQAREFSRRAGIRVNVQVSGNVDAAPDEYRTCIYRLIQESLTNCMRHASAKQVELNVREQGRVLRLEVRDDGVGFTTDVEPSGIGLLGMQERVRELGGSFTIDSSPGKGTSLRVELALPA